jgi:geranylgeranyl pyrophosphate synthase
LREQAGLSGYAQSVGLAFQIADDLLDVCGNESNTGKRVAKDNRQRKLTFPAVFGVERSRQLLQELYGDACKQLEILGSRAERLKELARFIVERDR